MVFAFIGFAIVAPFAFCLAMVLSLESHRSNQVRRFRTIADDWRKYLDEFDTHSEQIREINGATFSRFDTDNFVFHKSFDGDLASAQRRGF